MNVPISALKLKPRSSYLVTPPAIVIRSGHYYLAYRLKGLRQPIKKATHLPVVTDETDPKERRIIEKQLQEMIDEVVEMRVSVKLGIRTVDRKPKRIAARSFETLLKEYNEENRARAGADRSQKTLKHRETALNFLRRELPNTLPNTLTREQVIALRDRSVMTLAPASVRGYFLELRMLMTYAVEMGYAAENPFAKVPVRVPDVEPVILTDSHFERIVRFLYGANRPYPELAQGFEVLKPLLVERFTAIRGQDVLRMDLTKYDREKREVRFYNSKGRRWETQPVSRALELVFSWCEGERVSSIATVQTIGDYLKSGLESAGIPNAHYEGRWYTARDLMTLLRRKHIGTIKLHRIGTHHFKKAAIDDLDHDGVPDRIITLASHHTPKGETGTLQKHYARNRKPWLDALDSTQARFLPLLESLPCLPVDVTRYAFTDKAKMSAQNVPK